MNKIEYENLIAFHPGYYINDMIEEKDLSVKAFANKLGVSESEMKKLINGDMDVSSELANKLSETLGTSKDLWLNLQNSYNIKYEEIKKKHPAVFADALSY